MNFIKKINPDLFEFLTVDINSEMKVQKMPNDEIYRSNGNYFEIVGMKRQTGIFRWFLQGRLFGNKRVFIINN